MFFYSACAVTVHSCYHTVHNAVTTYNVFYTVVNARFMTLLLMSFRNCTGRLAVVNAICSFTVHTLHCDLCISVIAHCMKHFFHGASNFLYIVLLLLVVWCCCSSFLLLHVAESCFFYFFYYIALCMARLFM